MKKKSLLVFITTQTVVMVGLLYFLWGQNTNEFFVNEKIVIFIALFFAFSIVLGLTIQSKKLNRHEKGVRREGIVKWFNSNKGFGFIEQNTGSDIFVHQSEILQSGFRYLNVGDQVEFEVGSGKKGPIALKVVRTKTAETENVRNYFEEPEESPITQVTETHLN